ncbi:MAG TPA: sn-glycerol-3-phosphate ABC transporter ATP-binding protein UgpC [Solirubrobacteraceae bacterium]|nr:sn-glycerol-3-phosphate ABC transporter ATP-binding protein UgpC [Solirubrobacteraceae bacterium]
MGTVSLENITKEYPNGFVAVHDFNLEIADGEFMVLVGPSGCGKTTILRMVAGLEPITGGTLRINEREANDLGPRERDIAMVFQNYALYPHMTVGENIGFALELRKMAKDERARRVQEAARLLGLEEHLSRKPAQLSGGQRQRVAMGRAIVRQPAAFLMDEPLSNLDAKLRVQMRAEIMRLQRRIGVATMYVTHDQTEAMTMGDRVAVLRDGHLQQVAPPQELYDRPANTFVASFIGSPAMNMYQGSIDAEGGWLALGEQRLALPPGLAGMSELRAHHGRPVIVGIRPEHLRDAALPTEADPDALGQLKGDVDVIESLGSEKLIHFRIGAARHRIDDALALEDAAGAGELGGGGGELASAMREEGVARVAPESQIHRGEVATFSVVLDKLQLFDAETGLAIGLGAAPATPGTAAATP